ncbi:manno-octulosonate cytidylyltransferase [Rhodovulum sp. FJ3]|uniref:3-deoxy-manno-octulosonate cytidylyltransferase n=1 Tax=Rhodovulum sp. FJ3 TaxID=3079053 RepID=UPI00293DFF09|nr:manno-octulosonate cytidylyltransferase [Rhodovulum sp. FJ3]MDV4169078.1 manno-octulosonate cytidylyltransferase [Rhodovulum sp. FJ3]
MSFLIVIPARYASTRYPGKPLVELRGAGGTAKSLIRRSWEAAMAVPGNPRVVVATDDDRIREAAEAFGAEVVMTATTCANGTERCAEAYQTLGETFDVVVNLQGDAPLTPAWFVDELVAALRADPTSQVATPVLRCDGAAVNAFLEDRRNGRVGGTTAVFGAGNKALYFSKEVIPYTGQTFADDDLTPVFHHVGCYAYRPEALVEYPTWPAGALEDLEGLEQLRFMEREQPVLCVEVDGKGRAFWELNNPSDVERIEMMLAQMGAE